MITNTAHLTQSVGESRQANVGESSASSSSPTEIQAETYEATAQPAGAPFTPTIVSLKKPLSSEAQKAQDDMWKANEALNDAYFAQIQIPSMDRLRAEIDRIGQTKPVAATELSSEEADVIRKLLQADGRGVTFGEDGVYMALLDDKMYTFTQDGKATVHENGVPTSEEEKQSWLSSLQNSLDGQQASTGWLTNEQLVQNLKDAEEAARAASEKFSRLAGDSFSGSGQIHNEQV